MRESMKTLLPVAVGAIAVGVIVVGLAGGSQPAPTIDDRVENLTASIKCPFCNGESLADSPSGVAGDYRDLIEARVRAGATDDEILDEFAANFGDSYILDGSTTSWTVALWGIPVAMLVGGLVTIVAMRRRSVAPRGGSS